ncbi:MAG: tetratricopeptide repeat protein [Chloroflexota bacterium]
MAQLSDDIYDQIRKLSAEGDALASARAYGEALQKYWAAWNLLPQPRVSWEAATWLLVAIGDVNFLGGNFEAGRDNLSNAMHCPGAIGNPFIHLRLGQCQFELGNEQRAADELTRAYMGDGYEIFKHEDPKYFRFLKSKLKPPPNGWEDEIQKPWWKVW